MEKSPLWVFSDESGDLAQQGNRFVVFGVVVTPEVRILQDIVKKTRQRYPKHTKSKSYLHAADNPPEVTKYLLELLSTQKEVSIGVMIFDRAVWMNQNQNRDDLYQKLMGHAIQLSLPGPYLDMSRSAGIQVVVENRYKNRQRERLITTISSQTGVAIENIRSVGKTHGKWGPALQVADTIAWSWYQKVEKEDDTFVSILANKLSINEAVLGVDWDGEIRPKEDIIGG